MRGKQTELVRVTSGPLPSRPNTGWQTMGSGARVRVLSARSFDPWGWEVRRCPPRQRDRVKNDTHTHTVAARLRTTHAPSVAHVAHSAHTCANPGASRPTAFSLAARAAEVT